MTIKKLAIAIAMTLILTASASKACDTAICGYQEQVKVTKVKGKKVVTRAYTYRGDLVSKARMYIGKTGPQLGLPKYLWCADFMNLITNGGTGSRAARSYASYGTRVSGPTVGAIAVMSRGRRGGHVGIVSAIDRRGNPVIISGNHGRRVAEAVYPKHRIYAYRMP